jgi:hypothetical protein
MIENLCRKVEILTDDLINWLIDFIVYFNWNYLFISGSGRIRKFAWCLWSRKLGRLGYQTGKSFLQRLIRIVLQISTPW